MYGGVPLDIYLEYLKDKMILERFAYTPLGTFGRLKINNKEWYTVERPWLNNKKNISCVPEGFYRLERYDSPTKGRGQVWQFENVKGRTYIQIHKGNTPKDVVGCIALGTRLGVLNNAWAVLDSRTAFKELMNETKDLDKLELTITHYKASYTGYAEEYL